MRKLRLPETLAFAVLVAGAVAAASSCSGDGPGSDASVAADAYEGCTVFCLREQSFDDGGPVPDGGPECPACADMTSGVPTCPEGCFPIG